MTTSFGQKRTISLKVYGFKWYARAYEGIFIDEVNRKTHVNKESVT